MPNVEHLVNFFLQNDKFVINETWDIHFLASFSAGIIKKETFSIRTFRKHVNSILL